MSVPPPVVHVVEDDASMRMALSRLLRAAGYEVREHRSAGEFLLADTGERPGCLILDVRMPGPSGLELQDALAKRRDPPPIIFLTGHGDIPMSVRAIKAGAVDFLTKPVKREALLGAVRRALTGDAEARTVRDRRSAIRSRYDTLTPREREVFRHVVNGKLNKQIAGELSIAERTVKAHRARTMEKMRVGSLAELVQAADHLAAAPPG